MLKGCLSRCRDPPQSSQLRVLVLLQIMDSPAEIQRKLKALLEEHYLYRPVRVTVSAPDSVGGGPNRFEHLKDLLDTPGALKMFCESCKDETSWERLPALEKPGFEFHRREALPQRARPGMFGRGSIVRLSGHYGTQELGYWCVMCKANSRMQGANFWLIAAPTGEEAGKVTLEVMKVGQWPRMTWSALPTLKRLLPKGALDLYKKGVANISEGYGIGALAYFRRLIEETTNELLDLVEQAAALDGNAHAQQAVTRARLSTHAKDRLELIKEVIPQSLRGPGNINPLHRLYAAFSEGLHARAEDECLATASELRFCFEFLFENLRSAMLQAREFHAKMKDVGPAYKPSTGSE